jgi:hypothetical protein
MKVYLNLMAFWPCITKHCYLIPWLMFDMHGTIHFFICCTGKKLIFSEAICRPQLPYLYRQMGNTVCLLLSKCYAWRQLQKKTSGTDTAQELILDEHFLEVKAFLLVWHRYWQWQRRRQYTDRLLNGFAVLNLDLCTCNLQVYRGPQ